jgi:aryl-alcohol dehydrogenase-like predicted oxidoreductase
MTKDRQFTGDDIRKIDPKFQEPRFSDYLLCAKKLEEWSLKKYNKPLYALAIRYVLDKGISVALWGARRPEQLQEIEAVWRWSLWPEDFAEIEQIKKETLKSPVGPEFMAPPSRLGKPKAA